MRNSAPSSSHRVPCSTNSPRNFCCDWIAALISATCSAVRPLVCGPGDASSDSVPDLLSRSSTDGGAITAAARDGAGAIVGAEYAEVAKAAAAAACGARSARKGIAGAGADAGATILGAALEGNAAAAATSLRGAVVNAPREAPALAPLATGTPPRTSA